ncbi:hypothetical protein [Candidatus Sororendozoicomonas aggregata]|uniref:hypothetical protein n=1 Tax=Candidatus Sororendozoicomonas aggregata TaxID=3073239 RepID=UPI002ED32D68
MLSNISVSSNVESEVKRVTLSLSDSGFFDQGVGQSLSVSMNIESELGEVYYKSILETLALQSEELKLELFNMISEGYGALLKVFFKNINCSSFYLQSSGIFIHLPERLFDQSKKNMAEMKRFSCLYDLHDSYRCIIKQLLALMCFNVNDFEARYSIMAIVFILKEHVDQFSDAV